MMMVEAEYRIDIDVRREKGYVPTMCIKVKEKDGGVCMKRT